MAKPVSSQQQSELSIEQLAEWFRTTSESLYQARKPSKLTSSVLFSKLEFFTPTAAHSPFARFEKGDTFSVGALLPKAGSRGAVYPVSVHMYVTDHGDVREVTLAAEHPVTKAAKETLAEYATGPLCQRPVRRSPSRNY